jgi:hypothetical protein
VIAAFRHPRPALRALWVVLLALAFVWQPVLLAAGAAHGSTHALAGEHGHDHDDHDGDAPGAPHGEDPWHGLMHVVHCCGALCVLPVEALALALAVPAAEAASPGLAASSSPDLPHPLRPPIAA